MPLRQPQSMTECLYFTNRYIGEKGEITAWVYRKPCPQCKKVKMGKPQGDEGSIKTRAKEYVCPSCGYTEEKEQHEESLMLEAKYTCPACGKEGEGSGQYKRKNYQGVPSYLVECQHCGEKIPVTKKLKEIKRKKKKKEEEMVMGISS